MKSQHTRVCRHTHTHAHSTIFNKSCLFFQCSWQPEDKVQQKIASFFSQAEEKLVSCVQWTMIFAKNCLNALICYTDFVHHLQSLSISHFSDKGLKIRKWCNSVNFLFLSFSNFSHPSLLPHRFLQKKKRWSMAPWQTTAWVDTLEVLVGCPISHHCWLFRDIFMPFLLRTTSYFLFYSPPPLVEAPPAQQATCKVRTQVIEVTRSMLDRHNVNFMLWPPCVEVQQCSGCCNSRLLQCVPTVTSSRYLQVNKTYNCHEKLHWKVLFD